MKQQNYTRTRKKGATNLQKDTEETSVYFHVKLNDDGSNRRWFGKGKTVETVKRSVVASEEEGCISGVQGIF